MFKALRATFLSSVLVFPAMAAENRIDLIRPDAPELAVHGPHPVGVRTLELVDHGRVDIVNLVPGAEHPRYDRVLPVEVWYPAANAGEPTPYESVLLRDGETTVTLHGRAMRDVPPLRAEGSAGWPLVIVSHGYPGNRYLLSHLGENLATKGYVVVSIDHPDSTYADQGMFGSTLVNRPLDQLFVLREVARLASEPDGFLAGVVNVASTGLIGYSMGGYGALIAAGGGVTNAATELSWGAPDGTLGIHLAGSDTHAALADNRVKAVIAFAPWGMERGFWDAEGLEGLRTPTLFVAGSVDDVSGYEHGVKALFEQTINADRWLLTFHNANHNVAAPMPAPAESWPISRKLGYAPFDHYADPVWDTVRMNNISQHFSTAFLDLHLKGNDAKAEYLNLVEHAIDGVWAADDDGAFRPEHTYWKGFANRTAIGLSLQRASPAAAD